MQPTHRFNDKDIFPVRYFSEEERQQLLDTLEMLGFSVDSQRKRKWPFSLNDTNTYAINIKKKSFEYMGEPFVCAAMVSSGVRFYSVKEFCRMAELGFRVHPRFPVFHVPHDGERMPEELMSSVCIPNILCNNISKAFLIMLIKDLVDLIKVVVFMVNEVADNLVCIVCEVERKTGLVQ